MSTAPDPEGPERTAPADPGGPERTAPADPERPAPADPERLDVGHLRRIARPARLRRAPRYRGFVLAGVLLGAVVATVLVLAVPARPGAALGTGGMWLVLVLGLGLFGALLGATVAVVADHLSVRRAHRRSP